MKTKFIKIGALKRKEAILIIAFVLLINLIQLIPNNSISTAMDNWKNKNTITIKSTEYNLNSNL